MITLADLKLELKIDFNDEDTILQRKLDASIRIIERYTSWVLTPYSRTYTSDGCALTFYEYPIEVIDADKVIKRADSIEVYAKRGEMFTVNFGSNTLNEPQLDEAVIRLATYLYESREINEVNLPIDIQCLINKFRRGLI